MKSRSFLILACGGWFVLGLLKAPLRADTVVGKVGTVKTVEGKVYKSALIKKLDGERLIVVCEGKEVVIRSAELPDCEAKKEMIRYKETQEGIAAWKKRAADDPDSPEAKEAHKDESWPVVRSFWCTRELRPDPTTGKKELMFVYTCELRNIGGKPWSGSGTMVLMNSAGGITSDWKADISAQGDNFVSFVSRHSPEFFDGYYVEIDLPSGEARKIGGGKDIPVLDKLK